MYIFTGTICKPGMTKLLTEQNVCFAMIFPVNEGFPLNPSNFEISLVQIFVGRIIKLAVTKVLMQQSASFAYGVSLSTKILLCIK